VSGADDQAKPAHDPGAEGWMPEIEEIRRRRERAAAMGGGQKVERQRASGRLTVRERIERLADAGSFAEIGSLTGFADYDGDGRLISILPANFVAGTARIGGRTVMLGADDFTVRGGSGDAAIHAKQIYSEQYASQMRLPIVRLLDGASGGGSVKMAADAGYTRPGMPWWTTFLWFPLWRPAWARWWGLVRRGL
jgi:acetyl-CoA carboxylase carboxyltransferase component